MTALLLSWLRELFPGLEIFGPDDADLRLPNTVNVGLPGIAAHRLVAQVEGVALAAGAACHASNPQPSAVLTAMGIPAARALTALRLCTGRGSTSTTMEQAARAMAEAASQLDTSP